MLQRESVVLFHLECHGEYLGQRGPEREIAAARKDLPHNPVCICAAARAAGRALVVVGNLPYQITSPPYCPETHRQNSRTICGDA